MVKIADYELKLWKNALKIEQKRLVKLSNEAKDDPTSNLINIHIEFNDLLKSGVDRTSKQFSEKINELARRENREKERSMRYDLLKAFDKESNQKFLVDEIIRKISILECHQNRNKQKKGY